MSNGNFHQTDNLCSLPTRRVAELQCDAQTKVHRARFDLRDVDERAHKRKSSPLLVGVAGGTGSGKSTLVRNLVAAVGDATAIEQDWYYRDRASLRAGERALANYDEPTALDNALLVQHLADLRAGNAVDCPKYDFTTHARLGTTRRVEPKGIIVVEGILLFAVPELRRAFDVRVFVDVADDIRLLRRIRRDVEERGRTVESVTQQYLKTVRPMHLLHVAPTKNCAHVVILEGGRNAAGLEQIVRQIRALMHHERRNGGASATKESTHAYRA